MRYYSANVNIAGDRNSVVRKTNLTAAEVMVLQSIHGSGEVYDISKQPQSGRDNTPHAEIKDHLMKRYGRVRTGPASDRRPVLVAVFPGWPNVTLPSDIDKAGIDASLLAEDEKPAKARNTSRTAAQSAGDTAFTE